MNSLVVTAAGRGGQAVRDRIAAFDRRGAAHYGGSIALIALAYYLAGRLGLELAYLDGAVAALWPPAGLGLAVLFLYYVVAEAITNVAKYAQASHANVAVRRSNGSVTVAIVDDGVGGADVHRGSGLRGLAARVEALNGRLEVDSPLQRGTRIRAVIPSA